MFRTKVEHLLCLAYPADQRTGQLAALQDEVENSRRRMRLCRCTHQRHGAIQFEQLQEWIQVMWRSDRIQDNVELVGMARHLFRVGGNTYLVGTQPLAILDLAWRGGKQHHMGSHRMRDLHAHMPETAETDNTHFFSGPGPPMAQRRVSGDT